MKSLWAAAAYCLALFSCSSLASAQVGIYGNFNLTHASAISSTGTTSTSETFYGGGGGVYDEFIHLGPVGAGVDVRGDYAVGGLYHYRNLLGGLRLSVKPPVLPIRPYLQLSAGVGGTRYTGTHSLFITQIPWGDKLLYEILGGIDSTILPHVDFRVVEIGVGRQKSTDDGAPSDTLLVVNTGLVLRF